jgi:hypothetical protein
MPTSFALPIAFLGAGVFLFLVVLLHFLKPELDPAWRMLSEYAIGRHGWMMKLAFFCLSTSCLALTLVFLQRGLTMGVLLAIASIGSLGSAAFITDPITRPWNLITRSGRLHVWSAAVFVLGFPIAVAAITWNAQKHLLLRSAPNLLNYFLLPVWIGVILFVCIVSVHQAHRYGFGPDTHRLAEQVYARHLCPMADDGLMGTLARLLIGATN